MCGIGGQVRFDGQPVSRKLLETLSRTLEHRGRDDHGLYQQGPVGFVHQRLSIIDLSPSAHQPMVSRDGDLVVTFNGEIFNYLELRAELAAAGCEFRSHSDTEVLLHAYARYGIEFLDKIEGMFAFGLWDRKRQVHFLVRDRLGIKPLYYHLGPGHVTFGSEIKALVRSGACRAELDPHGLKEYLHLQLYLGRRTLFRGVQAVEPGTFLRIDASRGAWRTHRYWAPPEGRWCGDYRDALAEARSRITDAVRLWSRADVPVSAYVSGGLDSSAIAVLASGCVNRSIQERLLTFSSLFPNAEAVDERPFSDAVAEKIGSEHHRIYLDEQEVVADHADLMYALDMPIAGYSAAYRTMARQVRRHTKVVLTGHGGDELFGGYPKYFAAAFAARALNSHLPAIPSDAAKYLVGFERQVQQILSQCGPGGERDILEAVFFRSPELWNHVSPGVRERADDYDVAAALAGRIEGSEGSCLSRLLRLDQAVLLPGLLHVEDRTSMMENLESRTPLLDRRVVEFSRQLPDEFLLIDGLKGIMRASMAGVLPESVARNPRKSGILHPTTELLDGPLREQYQADLDCLDRAELFASPARQIIAKAREGSNHRTSWALWCLGGWIRAFAPSLG